jgi:hypothetical protein
MCNVRIIECPACDGAGGFESAPYGVNYQDGSVLTHWECCDECHGECCVVAIVQPCTLEDLENQDELERSAP